MKALRGAYLRGAYLIAGVCGIGFFVLSMLLLGVWPGQALDEEIHATAPKGIRDLTAGEKRGRVIYGREGCAYCHSQQIRSVDADVARFGKATSAWETKFEVPHLWGTRRIGPDLSRETGVRSADWQFSHLYKPQALVRDSIMPAFEWLFDGAPDQPNREGRDLVEYLETLGRNRELSQGDSSASPSKQRRTGVYPILARSTDLDRGRRVYERDCASCHGDSRDALGLHPKPSNFAEHQYSQQRLSGVLWNGVAGTAMPAWRDLDPVDLAAVATTVRSFSIPDPKPALESELGAQVYKARCAQCHGSTGAGDGSAASQFAVAATNFQQQRPNLARSLRVLREGIEGTPMARWEGELSQAELTAVASQVRTFYKGGGK